ncbi:MAG: hypothetical protein J6M18_00965 [Actinomycetaceae bacterium]|nr:hypothetical protein [Actinomycetaceae bacterium]
MIDASPQDIAPVSYESLLDDLDNKAGELSEDDIDTLEKIHAELQKKMSKA